MARKLIYTACITILYSCNNTPEVAAPEKNLQINHTRPDIKSEACIMAFDSATAYADIGDFTTAQSLLIKCNRMEPGNATILNTLGSSFFALKDSVSALKYFYAAIEADSSKPEAYASAGCLLEMQEKFPEALSILKKGHTVCNSEQFTYYGICLNLAVTYLSMDSCSQAEKYIEMAKQHGSDRRQFDARVQQIEQNITNHCR